MKSLKIQFILFAGMILLVAMSCTLISGPPPTAEISAFDILTPESSTEAPNAPSSTAQPGAESPEATQEISASPVPQQEAASSGSPVPCEDKDKTCVLDGTFLLKRPIGADWRDDIDTASRYGTLRKRIRDTYYGVQFLNSTGTPVYAAAGGDVEVAGDDSQVMYGPRLNMYGNLVIIKHTLPGVSEPVYTLYAHLSEISVKAEGDVEAGEQIGLVGMTGSTRGSTLYFEVRYGKNTYEAARNPELWLEPQTDETGDPLGALAGRVLDKQGNYVHLRNILIENLRTAAQGKMRQLYLKTYLDQGQLGLDPWKESFAASYLPEGTYQISFWYHSNLYQREVEVQPGKLTYVTFEVK
jgi:murein DD-endopeptidase MepM/ murein hydrolase activator NlpD